MPVLGIPNLFLMIGFQPEEIAIEMLDPGAGLRQSCPIMGLALCWLLCYGFDFNIFFFLSCSALGKSYSRFRWGCVPALSYTAPSGVSKENFTQKESNFPEAGTLVALPFLQCSHRGVGSQMGKMDINCHKRTLPWLTWCYSTSSDVLLDGISLVKGYNMFNAGTVKSSKLI